MAIVNVSDSSFDDEVLAQEGYVLVDFWAEWCGPCKMLAPVVEAISESFAGKVKVAKCDVDANPSTAQKLTITSIPCNILFKDGKEVDRIIGHLPLPAFEKKLTQFLA